MSRRSLKDADHNEDLLVRYLLGQLSEAEQERVEQSYLADEEWQQRLALAEDDLIDDYVLGTLRATERAAFEEHFLASPRRRERVAFARVWRQWVNAAAPPATPRPRTAWQWRGRGATMLLVAATVLLLIGGAWLTFEAARLRRELARAQAERTALAQSEEQLRQRVDDERARNDDLSRQLAESLAGPTSPNEPGHNGIEPPAIASFVLSTGLAREAGGGQKLDLPRGAGQVRLQLLFREAGPTSAAATYRAALRTPEGRQVFSRDGLKARPAGAARLVTLPAANLSGGDYILTLERRNAANEYEAVAEYAFTVTRK